MRIRRFLAVAGALGVGVGLAVFCAGLLFQSATLVVVAAAAVFAAVTVVGIGLVLLCRRLLRPLAQLAEAVATEDAAAIDHFLDSDVAELVAVASAVQQTQARLTSSLAHLERDRSDIAALFEHMADGVLVIDAQDRVELANPAACRLLLQSQLHGRPLATVVRDPDVLQVVLAARDGSTVRHPVELRGPNERRICLQVVATQLPIESRILVLLQDITELRHAEIVRRDFVANVSHELRTPVASLKALVETLEAGGLEDPKCGPDFLRRMHVEVDGLAHLVTELLELARIEAGRLDLDLQPCRADELICSAIERVRPYASRVGLTLRASDMESDLLVCADPRQIGQVLSNLLANAIKFTPPSGHIELWAKRDGPFVEIFISDSGVGIARHDLIRVFERFYKSDPSRTGGGTGLGLAICKHVVQAHGGSILAESDGPGRGATFRFTLPAAVQSVDSNQSVYAEFEVA